MGRQPRIHELHYYCFCGSACPCDASFPLALFMVRTHPVRVLSPCLLVVEARAWNLERGGGKGGRERERETLNVSKRAHSMYPFVLP